MYTAAPPTLPDGSGELASAPGSGRAGVRLVGRTALLLGITSALTDASTEMVAAVLPVFLTLQLGLTPLQFGFVDGLYQGASVLVRVLAGYVSDRWRRLKLVATCGYALSAASKFALLGVGTSLPLISAAVAADRTGKGIRSAPRDALIAADTHPSALGRAFGLHRALDTAGAAAGPLLAFAVLALAPGDYDAVFLVSACLAVVGLAVLVLLVRERPERLIRPDRPASLRRAFGLLRDRAYRRTVAAAGILALLSLSDGFLYLVLQRRLALATELFPLLFLGTAVVYLVLAVPLGRLADRVGRLRVFVAGHVVLVMVYVVLQVPLMGALTLALVILLLGAHYAATDGVLTAAVAGLVPTELRTSGIALAQTAVAAGRLLAAVAFGAVWTMVGRGPALLLFTVALGLALPVAARLLLSAGTTSRA